MNENNVKVVGAYLRVSTEDQAKEGFSLSEQKERITQYCEMYGYKIYDYYEDAGISAKTGNKRPEFDRMLEDAKNKKIDTIIAIKLDRISRSIYDMEKIMKFLEDNNIKLICMYDDYNTTTANGKMLTRIMMSVSQNEIERTSERTKIGMDGAIKAGHIPGLTPLGYRRENKCLVVDPVDAELVKRIFTEYSRGISHFYIAKALNEEGIKGKTWYDSVIGKIIRNPVYIGDYIANRGKKNEKYYHNVCPPIIDKKLWDYCQGQAPKNLRHYKREKEYIFLQKLTCPKCGRIMGGKATTKKSGKEYYYYSCNVCKNNIKEDNIERQIIDKLNEIFEYDGIVNSYYFPLLKNKLGVNKRDFEKEMKLLENKKDRIADAYISGSFDKETYDKKKAEIDRQIKELNKIMLEENQLDKLTFAKEDLLVKRDWDYINQIRFPELYDTAPVVWKNSSREKKTNIIMDFIEQIELLQTGRIIHVGKIIFRDSFYDNFHQLFLDGYLDVTILRPVQDHKVKIRLSTFRTREDVMKHIDKLRTYHDVMTFPGIMNFETGKIIHTMEDNYDFLRIIPNEPIEYNNGFKGTHPITILGVLREEGFITDEDIDPEYQQKLITEKILELTKRSEKDIVTLE